MHGLLVAHAATSRWKSTWFPASCAVGGGQFGITLARAIRSWSVDFAEREQKIFSSNVIQCSRRRRRRLSADFHAPNQAPISACRGWPRAHPEQVRLSRFVGGARAIL